MLQKVAESELEAAIWKYKYKRLRVEASKKQLKFCFYVSKISNGRQRCHSSHAQVLVLWPLRAAYKTRILGKGKIGKNRVTPPEAMPPLYDLM